MRLGWVIAIASAGCVDHSVEDRPPCQARVITYDVSIVLEDDRACVEPPDECRGQPLFDVDLDALGTQLDCSVVDGRRDENGQLIATTFAECNANASARPCWRIVPGDTCAERDPMAPAVMVEVVRGAPPPPGTTTYAYCLACLADWYGSTR